MVKTGEEIIIEGLLAQFKDVLKAHGASKSAKKPLGDEALRIEMRQLTKNIRSMQSQAMADAQHRRVRENIERRAELRDKTSVRMPNIARLLTGGAESPVAGFGRMQKAATKPFKAIYDYKKAQDESAAFKEEMRQEKSADPNFTMSRKQIEKAARLEDTESGAKKRAGSGMGKNLMGKRMQGMIGKVGKFMESSKGQGMMAGGMMGASILTMIIKKAMEASPMLQQMLKIMNVAMTLFLRPIGDFIGGMLKPIMLFFLREVAVPMLRKGKDMIKFGEQFGKNVMGFLLKPIETIQAAIIGSLGVIVGPEMAKLAQNFDGMKEWMTEQKMNVLASEMGFSPDKKGRQQLIDIINKGDMPHTGSGHGGRGATAPGESSFDTAANAQLEAEFGTGFIPTLQDTYPPLTRFKQLMTDLSDNTYTYVTTQMKLEGSGLAVAEGMGAITGQFTLVSEATGKVVTAMKDLETQITGGGWNVGTSGKETDIVVEGDVSLPESTTTKGDDWTNPNAIPTTQNPQNAHWSNRQIFDTPAKMLAAAGTQLQAGLKAAADSEEYIQARLEYEQLTAGKTRTVLEGIQELFEKTQGMNVNIATIQEQTTSKVADTSVEILNWTTASAANFKMAAEVSGDLLENARNALATMHNQAVGGNISNSSSGGTLYTGGTYTNQSATFKVDRSASWGFQHGGMINEPIWGIGKSGQSYMFGEAGPERITSTGASTRGGVGDVTINVNVDSINSDVDLEKIKPVIERALQEVHSRRGII